MDRVQPGAIGSLTHSIEAGAAWGQFSRGWIVPGSSPSRPATASDEIDEAELAAFGESHSANSLTVTVAPGEAFVDGWVARDESTDVDLAPSTAGQTIYLGWDTSAVFSDAHATRDHADRVIVGLDAAFDGDDPQAPLWTVSTDGGGVTGALDERSVGPTVDAEQTYVESVLGLPTVSTRTDIPDDRPEKTAAAWWVADERSLVVDDDGDLVDVSTIDTDELVDDSVTRPKISSDAVGSTELDYSPPLSESNQTVTVSLGDGLEIDANGRVYISGGGVGSREVDLRALAGDGLAHGGGVLFIPTDGVGTPELAADAVDGTILASESVSSVHIATDAVGASEIDVDAVGVSELDYVAPLTSSGRQLDLAVGDGLGVDNNGRLHIPTNAISTREVDLGGLSGNALSYSNGSFHVASGSITDAEISHASIGRTSIGGDAVGSYELDRTEVAGDGIDGTGADGLGVAYDGVKPRHVDDNQTFNINVDRVDGREASEFEEQTLVADDGFAPGFLG